MDTSISEKLSCARSDYNLEGAQCMKKFTVGSDNRVYLEQQDDYNRKFLLYKGELNIDNGFVALPQRKIMKFFNYNYENFGCDFAEEVLVNGKKVKCGMSIN